MTEFATESVAQVVEEIEPLLRAHWEEIAAYKDKVPLAPDYEQYRKLEELGKLLVCTARDDGKLIGYGVYIVNRGFDYSKNIVAVARLFYVEPGHRGDSLERIERELVADSLLEFGEEKLKARGVSVISLHIKVWKDWSGLAESRGYTRAEYIHQKYVG